MQALVCMPCCCQCLASFSNAVINCYGASWFCSASCVYQSLIAIISCCRCTVTMLRRLAPSWTGLQRPPQSSPQRLLPQRLLSDQSAPVHWPTTLCELLISIQCNLGIFEMQALRLQCLKSVPATARGSIEGIISYLQSTECSCCLYSTCLDSCF